jgi:hypothetical protein
LDVNFIRLILFDAFNERLVRFLAPRQKGETGPGNTSENSLTKYQFE